MNATANGLPVAVESERQVLATLAVEPSQIANTRRMLAPSAMTMPENRAFYEVLIEADKHDEPTDLISLKCKLERRPEFTNQDVTVYLADLGRNYLTNARLADHTSRIAEADVKRRLHYATSALAEDALNGKAADELLADLGAVFEDFHRERDGRERFKPISAKELAEGDYRVNWIIDWLLVEGQPCILAGGKKCLKTTLLCDLLISIATGGLFLGKWQVGQARRVILFSAESGEGALQETCKRIAAAKGWDLADVANFTLITDVPRLDCDADLAAFEAVIDGEDVVALDPAYLMMPGGDAGNLFIQGEMLLKLSRLCQRLSLTLIICHHTKKHRSAELTTFDPPELEDIAWAGFQEFARQWLLVGRRERYIGGTGEHRLWFNFGGSAGHSGLWAIDANEGVPDSHVGRYWDVSLSKPSEIRDEAEQRKVEAKAEQAAKQFENDRTAVCGVLAKHPDGLTGTRVRDLANIGRRYSAVLESMVEAGDLERCELITGNQKTPKPGYRLKVNEDA